MNNPEPIARKENIVVQKLDNETLVYDLDTNKAVCLNETSCMIWNYCNGKNSVEKIADLVSVETKALVSTELVELCIEQLHRESLLDNNCDLTTSLTGLSRREAIKRIGLSTAIALPIVASIAAPSAVQAQSCRANGDIGPCNSGDAGCNDLGAVTVCPDASCCTGCCGVPPMGTLGNCVAGTCP